MTNIQHVSTRKRVNHFIARELSEEYFLHSLPLLLWIRVGGEGFENLYYYKNFIFFLPKISLTTAPTPQRTFLCATKGLKE